jgi:hypothetical protein
MATLTERDTKKDVKASKTHDDFDMYLKEQRLKTTFNGVEVAEFASYKKFLGINKNIKK